MFSSNLQAQFKAASFSKDDVSFIQEMCGRFPDVKDGFERAATYPSQYRYDFCAATLTGVTRSGWKRIGVPEEDLQTVADHSVSCATFGIHLYPNKIHLTPMMLNHDVTESVVTDFTPHDPITSQEKHRLEKLGLTFMLVNSRRKEEKMALWLEFEEQKTPDSHCGFDIDKLEMILQAPIYELRYPHLKEKLDEFWTYVDARLKTPEGREFFGNRQANRLTPHPLKLRLSEPYISPVERWTNRHGPNILHL